MTQAYIQIRMRWFPWPRLLQDMVQGITATFVAMIDIFISFPGILLAIVLAGLLGPGLANTVIALSIVSWVGFSRLARIQTLSIKNRDHIIAAHALGTLDYVIALKHI